MEGSSQLGGQGGQGQSAETAAVKIRVMPASSNSFLIMVEMSSYFLEFELELSARLGASSNGRAKVLHHFGKQNISGFW
jgi:hypothetical protein